MWVAILWTYIAIMFYILPYFLLIYSVYGDGTNSNDIGFLKKLFVRILYIVYLLVSNKFLSLFKQDDSKWFLSFYLLPVNMMEFLCLVGILFSAMLSGYGSTHCILNFLIYPFFKQNLEKSQRHFKERMTIISEEISQKQNEINICLNINENNHYNNNNNFDAKSFFKGVYNFVLGKDNKKDMKEELDELRVIYNEMEMQVKLIKQKTLLFRNNFISGIKYFFTTISGQILAVYCIYRIVMTIKNLLFQKYSDINVMLREELLNIVDFMIDIIFSLLNLDVETVYHTVIEQYFSLLIVGSIIIINIRSFLNTILFIYTKTFKKYNTRANKKVQLLFLSYCVGLFYITSSIFLIFNLPITYRYYILLNYFRTEVVKVYGNLDYSLLKYLYDKTFIYSAIIFAIIEVVLYHIQTMK